LSGGVFIITDLRQVIKDAPCRIAMDRCLCRVARDCKDCPQDIGRIFIREGAQVAVENGIGRELALGEPLAYVDRAARMRRRVSDATSVRRTARTRPSGSASEHP